MLARPDRVGDVLIATACLQPFRDQCPGQLVYFVAREALRPLLEGHPLLAGFIGLPADGSLLGRGRALAGRLRAIAASAIVHLHPDGVCQAAARFARLERRIGYASSRWLDWTLTDRFPDARQAGRQHEALYNFELLAPLGIAAPPLGALRPSVHLADRYRESLAAKMGAGASAPIVVLNPTAHSPVHRWPAENFAWLGRELSRAGQRIVLVGEPAGDASVATVRALLKGDLPGLLDLSGRLDLGELGWLLRDARLLVSRNTGTTHLAAAVGCPIVEMFGRLEPAYGPLRWGALGARVKTVTRPALERRRGESKRTFWRRGYASIPREDVLRAALELLG